MRPTTLRAVAAASLVGVAAVWGATFPLGKIVLRYLGPFQYLGLRFALAAALMLPFARRDLRSLNGEAVGRGIVTGAVLFCAYALQTLGLRATTASEAGLITGMNVVIVPLLAMVWLKQRSTPLTIAGVITAACGLWLLAGQGMRPRAGDLLVLGCAGAIAVHIVLVGRFAAAFPPGGFATLQIGTVAVLAAAAGMFERRAGAIPLSAIGAVAFMAVAATGAAYLVQTWAQRFTSAARVGLLFTVEPVAALAFGILWLGERLNGHQAVGAAAILAGVVMGVTRHGA
ncbi:MAG TPA: DMT family transporter [bacterium]|nr:DMT family transporter [bacterium]